MQIGKIQYSTRLVSIFLTYFFRSMLGPPHLHRTEPPRLQIRCIHCRIRIVTIRPIWRSRLCAICKGERQTYKGMQHPHIHIWIFPRHVDRGNVWSASFDKGGRRSTDGLGQFITLSVHLCAQHDAREAGSASRGSICVSWYLYPEWLCDASYFTFDTFRRRFVLQRWEPTCHWRSVFIPGILGGIPPPTKNYISPKWLPNWVL